MSKQVNGFDWRRWKSMLKGYCGRVSTIKAQRNQLRIQARGATGERRSTIRTTFNRLQ